MTREFLDCVTVTGADDTVDPLELVRLADRYPFVEFGILLSFGSKGLARFPSDKWLEELRHVTSERPDIKLSGHICGRWVKMVYSGVWPVELIHTVGMINFKRYQLNTHAVLHVPYVKGLLYLIEERTKYVDEIIFQYDGVNMEGFEACVAHRLKVSGLYDLSHGAGILPKVWPRGIPGCKMGYAGGLRAENVGNQLGVIEALMGETERSWIDAETHLRTRVPNATEGRYSEVFDLGKVTAFLDAARPWVAK